MLTALLDETLDVHKSLLGVVLNLTTTMSTAVESYRASLESHDALAESVRSSQARLREEISRTNEKALGSISEMLTEVDSAAQRVLKILAIARDAADMHTEGINSVSISPHHIVQTNERVKSVRESVIKLEELQHALERASVAIEERSSEIATRYSEELEKHHNSALEIRDEEMFQLVLIFQKIGGYLVRAICLFYAFSTNRRTAGN